MSFDTQQEEKEHKVKILIQEPKALAKQRLMDFAASLPDSGENEWDEDKQEYVETRASEPVTYTELIERATEFQTSGEYWNEGGRFEGTGLYQGFWDDYALVTELPVTDTFGFFSCSC